MRAAFLCFGDLGNGVDPFVVRPLLFFVACVLCPVRHRFVIPTLPRQLHQCKRRMADTPIINPHPTPRRPTRTRVWLRCITGELNSQATRWWAGNQADIGTRSGLSRGQGRSRWVAFLLTLNSLAAVAACWRPDSDVRLADGW
jgi:pSer/pThr/pTyr-binding forkhead associated (FHA) protein